MGLSLLPSGHTPWANAPLCVLFHGGGLLPATDVVLGPFATDGNGDLLLSGSWPAGLGARLETFYQAWIGDRDAIGGFSVSNAIAGLAP